MRARAILKTHLLCNQLYNPYCNNYDLVLENGEKAEAGVRTVVRIVEISRLLLIICTILMKSKVVTQLKIHLSDCMKI